MEEKRLEEDFSRVKTVVEGWFVKLQNERKCSITNTVSKIVNNSSKEVQEKVRRLISDIIIQMVDESIRSRNLTNMLSTCNTLNGCFDNFTHAADAVKYSFSKIVIFVSFAIDECLSECQKHKRTVICVVELLHCLSRILILILKLKRYDYGERITQDFHHQESNLLVEPDTKAEKEQLILLTTKLKFFLTRDDILIDTKSNFAICGILIREMIDSNLDDLRWYQKQVLSTISDVLLTKDSKLHHVQFLITSAIINTWSTAVIDNWATYKYLKFFISLCESYSCDTPIILNASRTLFLLIKHPCFSNFVSKGDLDKVSQIKDSLISCVFMLLEHPVACVRHSAKDFLLLLVSHSALQTHVIDSTFRLPRDKRGYFISIATVAGQIGTRALIEKDKNLPKELIESLYDPTMVSHVSFALENMILKDLLAENNFGDWCELWIIPLLISLMTVPAIVAAEIDKLLEKAFKKYPNSMVYITEKWKYPASGEEIRYVITALKISHKQGFKFKSSSSQETKSTLNDSEGKWKSLISEKLLKHCLHQGDDDIRISAFSLLVEARKSTEPYSEEDFGLINYFLKYNLNNHQPATRQKIISLMRKMLVRYSDSRSAILRQNKSKTDKEMLCSSYDTFLNSLVEFCFSNIFVGCNFNRLNTVLNILLICFNSIKDMSFDPQKTDYYWTKLLVALDSSYEENKELAVTLSRKLDYSHLSAAKPDATKALFEKSFCLIAHMEPPDVLTGSHLLQILIHLPAAKEILLKYFLTQSDVHNSVHYLVIKILAEQLKAQVLMAELDLMTAATCGPMYGTLSAIRLIFKEVDFSHFTDDGATEADRSSLAKWSNILYVILNVCFDMIPAVACVVNSSSPEGHLPMDFQRNFDNLRIDFGEGAPKEGSELVCAVFENFLKNFNRLESNIHSLEVDVYETLRNLKCLSKMGHVLVSKMKGRKNMHDSMLQVETINNKIEDLLEKLQEDKRAVEWPATAQVLLLCAWRSIKEAALYLGDFVSKLPIDTGLDLGFLSESTLLRIGEELKVSLCEIKHRGSFEHVYFGFTQFVNSLWKSHRPNLNNLPRRWLEEIADHLEMPAKKQTLKLCSTRRSAGLPFLVQAVICSEIVSVKSSTPSSLHAIMHSLLKITEKGVMENSDSKIHALNILRALFKHAQLGEHVSSYISKALMVAIRGSRGSSWSERNSSNLLFSSLMIRIFGVARSKDEISKKNRMTSKTFFQRYSELYEFLLTEMKLTQSTEDGKISYPKPSLYLILLILGRLYPTPREDAEVLDLSEFVSFINLSRRNPIMKIRELAARALVPLIPHDCLLNELNDRFNVLNGKKPLCQNEIHGILLQIKALLKEYVEMVDNHRDNPFGYLPSSWIEDTKWILWPGSRFGGLQGGVSCVVTSTYLKVLHVLFKNFPESREKIEEVTFNPFVFRDVLSFTSEMKRTEPGVHLCMENFFYLKLDILAESLLRTDASSKKKKELLDFLLVLMKCDVDEVRAVPLRIICSLLEDEAEVAFEEEEDFARIGGAPQELTLFVKKKCVETLRNCILNNADIARCLWEPLTNNSREFFKSKIIIRSWLRALCGLLVEGGGSGVHCDSSSRTELMKSMETFIKSTDKEISSNALLIYSVCFIRGMRKEEDRMHLEKFSSLIDEFSALEADTKDKLTVAKILNHCFDDLIGNKVIEVMNLWTVPVRLLLDECPTVRIYASAFVRTFLSHLKCRKTDLILPMDILVWPACNLVSLKALECLLDSYLNVTNVENRSTLLLHLLTAALSSCRNVEENSEPQCDEFGVFEKGNPNPYYEEVAVSNLISDRLLKWNTVVNIGEILRMTLNNLTREFIRKNFRHSSESCTNLLEVVKSIGDGAKRVQKERKEEFSIVQMQKKSVIRAFDLVEEDRILE